MSPPQALFKKRHRTGIEPRLAEFSHSCEGYALSREGVKIWYQNTGTGTPIIFCNGLGCSTFYWKHIHLYFKKSHRVVLFDWRGHGRSEKPASADLVTLDHLVEDMAAVMKRLKIKKAVLAGHSMGAQMLFKFYQKYPHKVMALVPCFGSFAHFLDTFYNSAHSRHLFSLLYSFNHGFPRLANALGILLAKNPLWYQLGGVLKMLTPGLADKKVLKQYLEHFSRVDPVFLTSLARKLHEEDCEAVLRTIRVPVLIFAAENDKFTPVWLSKKMHHLIANSELMVIKKASHVALIEQPALINLRLEKFLKEKVMSHA